MTARESFERSKARARQIEKPAGAKVTGVNRNTYATLAKEFILARGDTGFLIATKFTRTKGSVTEKTTDEWGAWLAYFFRMGIKTALMEAKGYYTVPSQWPHEFDENAPPEDDYEAAGHHRRVLHRRIAQEAEDRLTPDDLGLRIRTYWDGVKHSMPIWEDKKLEAKPRVYTPEEMAESLARCLSQNRNY